MENSRNHTVLTSLEEVTRYEKGNVKEDKDIVIIEKNYKLFLNNSPVYNFYCLPLNLEELGIGFLLNEGFVSDSTDFKEISMEENRISIYTSSDTSDTSMHTFNNNNNNHFNNRIKSGKIKDDKSKQIYIQDSPPHTSFEAEKIVEAGKYFKELTSELFEKTGSVHSSALCTGGKIIVVMQDIGRHNTLDKIMGWINLNKFKRDENFYIITTARITASMAEKLLKIGPDLVVSRAAPTTVAIEKLDKNNVTLIGFSRGERFNIYTHPERISF